MVLKVSTVEIFVKFVSTSLTATVSHWKASRKCQTSVYKASEIRQIDESQKTHQISLKQTFVTPCIGFFRKIWRALFTCYLRFEIRPLALLPTKVLENVPAKCRVK